MGSSNVTTSPAHKPRRARKAAASNRALDKILKDFEKQPAQFTGAQVEKFEHRFTRDWGFTRRAGLAFLALSGKRLIKIAEGADREMAIETVRVAKSLDEYSKRLTDFADFMKKSAMRLQLSMCWREDCEEIQAEAKKRPANGPLIVTADALTAAKGGTR